MALILVSATTWGRGMTRNFTLNYKNVGETMVAFQSSFDLDTALDRRDHSFSLSLTPLSPPLSPWFSLSSPPCPNREVNSQPSCCTSPGLGFQCAPSCWAGGFESLSSPGLTPCDRCPPKPFFILLWTGTEPRASW